jgi:hypothetical protein
MLPMQVVKVLLEVVNDIKSNNVDVMWSLISHSSFESNDL